MAIANYFHVTPAGDGLKNGSSWANAMGEPEFETHLEGAVVAGDVHFVKEGTYIFDSDYDFSLRDGTAISPIAIIGVKSETVHEGAAVVFSDWARDSADRPFFDGATYQFTTGDYCIIRNIYAQSSAAKVFLLGSYNIMENCKIDNDDATSANEFCVNASYYCSLINCEFLAATVSGLVFGGSGCRILFCYFYDFTDATRGIAIFNAFGINQFMFNVFNNCRIGLYSTADLNCVVLNNTFYDCDTAVAGSTDANWLVVNNIVEGSTVDGFKWTTQVDSNFFWNNHGNDARNNDMWDGVDTTTVYQDYPNAGGLSGDPVFTTPGSDFSLGAGSPCLDTGMSIELGV